MVQLHGRVRRATGKLWVEAQNNGAEVPSFVPKWLPDQVYHPISFASFETKRLRHAKGVSSIIHFQVQETKTLMLDTDKTAQRAICPG